MKILNRVSLVGLRAVEAVGRLGSLRAAAEEIGVTPGAISQQVQKTEAQLGTALFARQPKGMVLTEQGRTIMGPLSAGLSDVAAAVRLATHRKDNALTVSVAPVFAGKWLVSRLNRFYEDHPDIRIRIDAATDFVDPGKSDVDVCIRIGKGDWPGLKASKLADRVVFPVCSPAVAANLKAISDLSMTPIIRDRWAMIPWDTWLKPNGMDESVLRDGPVYSDASLCLDAAIAGQGVFLAWETLACDAIASGRLVAPFPGRQPTGFATWFVTSTYAPASSAIRAFEAWLRRELETSLGPD